MKTYRSPQRLEQNGTPRVPFAIHHGDCLDVLGKMLDDSIDSVVTDPPYGLSSEPDPVEVMRAWVNNESFLHRKKGFMGHEWDSFVPQPDYWREVFRVLKPGGHALVFAGARTQDWMAMSLRFAGFEIRDTIMWVFGSGLPKSLNIEKALIAKHSPQSSLWKGWGTALKPCYEPILLVRKPFRGSVSENVLKNRVGGINIDGCRVPTDETLNGGAYAAKGQRGNSDVFGGAKGMFAPGKTAADKFVQPSGRWPGNLVHDGSDQVIEGFPETSGQQGDLNTTGDGRARVGAVYGKFNAARNFFARGDTGSAARFFYCAKPTRAERHEGTGYSATKTTHGATLRQVENAIKAEPDGGNTHPTIKPKELMRWLVRMITPPDGVCLDPFTGSGTTGIACMEEGVQFVGIERELSYSRIAHARVSHAFQKVSGKPSAASEKRAAAEQARQKRKAFGKYRKGEQMELEGIVLMPDDRV